MSTVRTFAIIISTTLVNGCTNPLDFDDYRGQASAEFVESGEVYRTTWDINIHQEEKFSMDGNYDSLSVTPRGKFVSMHDGSAVWIDTDYRFGDSYNLENSIGYTIIRMLEEKHPSQAQAQARVYWMNYAQKPSIIKVTPWPCDPHFFLKDCQMNITFNIDSNYKGPDTRELDGRVKKYIYEYSKNNDGLRWLSALGEDSRSYAAFRFTHCDQQSWLANRIRDELEKQKIPPLHAIRVLGEVGGSAAEGGCESHSYPGSEAGLKWEFRMPGNVSAAWLNGENFGLQYEGNGVWAIPEKPERMIEYYRLENPRPDNDRLAMSSLRSIRGAFGLVSMPDQSTMVQTAQFSSDEYAFSLPDSEDIIVIMPLRAFP